MDTTIKQQKIKRMKASPSTPQTPKIEFHSPGDKAEFSEDGDWVKIAEEKIETLQNQMSTIIQKFAEGYESLWEQFCEKITELNEQKVNIIAATVGETARAEEDSRILKDELTHTQTLTSTLASKLLPEQ
ncbi:uncharacterized protein MONOS_2921 [Monocercomonoides exilis]|uniref:uncharacterized protein n=1 Tax=Monocercomonoides exilis TaxID=2049356 RepID=UPI00355A1392|nr:hypothetical protein MONOS_2921 [Monocercomonoides exilis]|eukprot:MONOS_2921.1-p1 / transcript=MONOS_2921.1 / gene=MONOS_2921 / organism=Monocercomonoides_exilis_PA203 / gene_product=unspecified product / transcript_product=unspecified product / location=Mono_scaffold00064:13524-13958(+) / protein_length=130 / sequence_SO=supercontig / SO=protein_coding / is_pseudo=false